MTDNISPALTPEEWKRPGTTDMLRWACQEVFVGDGETLDSVNRHGLAALCLYEQPFGFTQEDVDALTDAIYNGTSSARSDAAIVKIRALLPPAP